MKKEEGGEEDGEKTNLEELREGDLGDEIEVNNCQELQSLTSRKDHCTNR